MPSDALTTPMIFLRIAWMTRYQGINSGDNPVGGGSYVAEHGFGSEIFNFRPHQGFVYGYGQPPGRRERWAEAKIDLTRLGASSGDASVPGVLAVWVATSPTGGGVVVGWYKNATVFRDLQLPPAGSDRRRADTAIGYYISAKAEDAVLLPPDDRTFSVPQHVKGGFGRSNIWYAANPEQNRLFREDVLRYVESRRLPSSPDDPRSPRQPDPLLRQRVEQRAVEFTAEHYTHVGYNVRSVEGDNVGWDLIAVLGKRELRLEVKGLSGEQVSVELTPNEYRAMRECRDAYRICVVTAALIRPYLDVFSFSNDSGRWESANGRVLELEEIVALRCTAK